MKALFVSIVFGSAALLSASAYAADPPAGATATCKDGTYYTGASHKGACKGHQGVKDWLDKSADTANSKTAADTTKKTSTKTKAKTADTTTTAASTAKSDATTAATPAAPAAPATTPKTPAAPKTPATTEHTPPTPASQITQKAGGGPGLVWVNASSKVYHCPGDEWYGKTKEGSYMSEAAAKTAGNHASHGKECSS